MQDKKNGMTRPGQKRRGDKTRDKKKWVNETRDQKNGVMRREKKKVGDETRARKKTGRQAAR